jgi:ATP-dependent DNA helicase DinG
MPPQLRALVVVDTESTGLDPSRDRIIDIGAVRLDERLCEVDRFQTLVDPGRPIPLQIVRMTGITDEDAAAAPRFAEVAPALNAFAAGATLVAHNAAFDRELLAMAARVSRVPALEGPWLDTLEAALLLLPEHDRHALALLSQTLDLGETPHRALPDALATAALLRRLAVRAAGLATEERRLLEAVRWLPLVLLDQLGAAPEAAPPPLVADEPRTADRGGRLTTLPCEAGDWVDELGRPGETEAGPTWTGDDMERSADDRATPADGPGSEGSLPAMARRLPGFRHRPGQAALAAQVAETLADGGVGLLEAGTGMGKSLAYLLPAAFFSAATGSRVVVSTKTKALQRQLAAHELPLVSQAMPPGWRWTLLMGRENYLCRRRLDEAVAAELTALPDPPRTLALAYLLGRARWGDVDLSALPYRASLELPALADLARSLRSSRSTCLGRHCPARRHCHWRLARSRAEAAHLVCVNHALLLTGGDALPAHEHVIIDEAHLLPGEATSAYSEAVDTRVLEALRASLGAAGRQRPAATRLRALARNAQPGPAMLLVAAADACERCAEGLPGWARSLGESLAAVARVAAIDESVGERPERRGRRAARAEEYALAAWLTPGLREQPVWEPFAQAAAALAGRLGELAAAVAAASRALPDDHRERPALAGIADDAGRLAELLDELPDLTEPSTVVWAQIEPGQGPLSWTLTRTPVSPAPRVREALWDRLAGAVLTSATLSVSGSFSYFRRIMGLDGDVDVHEAVFPSPFDFRRQAVLVVEHDPGSDWRPDEAASRQAERLKRLAAVTGGRTLALFTNKRDMQQVAAAVGEHVQDEDVLVLAQGVHGSAAALAEEFRVHPQTVLLGVDTLWTGQDFPGEALVCLVIAKLPFPRQDPLVQARRQACQDEGLDWFRTLYLPEAVLKFRQGFGRLIRTETDVGVVVVLDHRLTQKGYRDDFLGSIPELEIVEAAPSELPAVVEEHLRRLRAVPELSLSS